MRCRFWVLLLLLSGCDYSPIPHREPRSELILKDRDPRKMLGRSDTLYFSEYGRIYRFDGESLETLPLSGDFDIWGDTIVAAEDNNLYVMNLSTGDLESIQLDYSIEHLSHFRHEEIIFSREGSFFVASLAEPDSPRFMFAHGGSICAFMCRNGLILLETGLILDSAGNRLEDHDNLGEHFSFLGPGTDTLVFASSDYRNYLALYLRDEGRLVYLDSWWGFTDCDCNKINLVSGGNDGETVYFSFDALCNDFYYGIMRFRIPQQ